LEPIEPFEIFVVSHHSPTFWVNPPIFKDAFLWLRLWRTPPSAWTDLIKSPKKITSQIFLEYPEPPCLPPTFLDLLGRGLTSQRTPSLL